jgi:hypothetical protein
MNKKIFVTLLFLLGVGIFGSINHVNAASLTQNTATPYDVTAGSTVDYAISFKTATTIANTGKIVIQFPTGFDVSAATSTSWTGFDGGKTLSVATQTITITRDATGTSSTAGAKTIVLSNIVNSTTTANNYQVIVTTKTSANAIIDGPTSSVYFQIFSTNTPTTVDGIYYLRDGPQTHYQNAGSAGSGSDVGTFSRTAPILNEERSCARWVQFYFDENGTYTATSTISNIYYHTWWTSTNNSGLLGYNITGAYNASMNESFTINSTNSPNKVSGYYLYAGQQTFATSQSIFGNAIYNFGVKFNEENKNPQIISSPTKPSFIILNLPASTTIATLGISQDGDTDYDNDELTDYDELFTYYTNPYDSDTDNDNWNDKYEIDNSLNPNDPDSAPNFGYFKQYNGGSVDDGFGTSISSIGDIDGDGKDDVLVGATGADPNGLSGAGSAYVYSSVTGSLIKQFDGGAAGDGFSTSISSIGDIDGDGKDDVLVGALNTDPNGLSGAGSAYVYSSVTGSLIKQFDGGAAGDGFGTSISSIGDIDGDRLDDVLVGATGADPNGLSRAGSVYIYSSVTGSLIKQFDGGAVSSYFGESVSSISDIDGDGLDDVLVGAIGTNLFIGSAYIYSSGTGNLIKQYNGGAMFDMFGNSISSISDIDGDRLDDVVIGDAYTNSNGLSSNGSVYIYSSGTGNLIKQYNGEAVSSYFGESVSFISDIDGDELDDVLIGTNSSFGVGSVYIYSSGTGNLIKQYNGEMPYDTFGYSVAPISDVDGDGKDDVLVGATGADPNGLSGAGSAYLYYSSNGVPIQSWSKNTSKENLDLDNYFTELNNNTIPSRNQTVTYTASTSDNPNIDVTIDSNNNVTFSQPTNWLGTETVRFTATDSTGLSSTSTLVTLMVTGVPNIPNNISLNNETEFQITASWSTNLNLSTTTYYIENTTAGTNSGWTSNTSWTSTGLSCGIVYSFRIQAKDGNGLISTSTPVSITTRGCVGGGGLPVNAIDLTSTPTPTPTPSLSVIPTPTSTPTPTDPQSILNSLLQQLASLQQQLANQQTKYIFTHSLQHGDTGEDVTQLQTFLKSQGIDIYPEGLITGYFGNLTKLAVQRFQVKYNIAKSGDGGYGYVGPKTREKMNSL